MQTRRLLVTLGAVAMLTTLIAPAALAQDEPGDDTVARITAGIEERCENVAANIARAEERIALLEGGVDTPGSIAWLEMWGEIVRDYGFGELARLIDDRVELKRATLDLAKRWLEHLLDFQGYCEDFDGNPS